MYQGLKMAGMKFSALIVLAIFKIGMAAGPMTHLYLGEKYCSYNIDSHEKTEEFLVGTLYPDIRYVAHFPREKTHSQVSSLDEVSKCPSVFQSGVKFHSWVDQVREEFVEKSGIYEFVIPYAKGKEATLLKFIEEEILANHYDGRTWSGSFDHIHEEELEFASEEQIRKWHSMIQYCMGYRISWLTWAASYLTSHGFGVSSEVLYEWSYLLPKFANDPRFQTHVRDLLSFIEEKMEESLP
jgi:hypothetical protein